MYEGEMILAEQVDRGAEGDSSSIHPTDEITQQQWDLIQNFLKNNASQLTIYCLFCLQEGLKEHELSVFFCNNDFSTMFKVGMQAFAEKRASPLESNADSHIVVHMEVQLENI